MPISVLMMVIYYALPFLNISQGVGGDSPSRQIKRGALPHLQDALKIAQGVVVAAQGEIHFGAVAVGIGKIGG